jgi:pimeloyl-ACP methyl ester carboxylesterase
MKVYRTKKMQQEIIRTYNNLLAQWDVETEEMDINTEYGTTHIVACGKEENPPLILFHGVGDDSALMWIYNAKYLSQFFRIYAVDTIGGPGKSVPGEGYNKDFDDVLWIDGVLDKLLIEKAFFAGVSHGGYLVKYYSLYRPERVKKGISISGAISVGEKGSPMATMMKIFLPEALLPTKRNIQKLIEKLCGENTPVFTENKDIMEHYTYLLRGFNNMAMGYHNVRPFTEEEVDLIRDKIEFLVGLEDPFEKLGGAEALRKYRMKVTFYENAGHGLNHERADEINAKIVEILTE